MIREAAQEALELCGLTDIANSTVSSLSTGHRRLVDLARCFAGDFDVILLDEPSSGLDHDETRQVGEVLKRVVADRAVSVLLVEHDLALVLDICSEILRSGLRAHDRQRVCVQESKTRPTCTRCTSGSQSRMRVSQSCSKVTELRNDQ